MKITFTSVLCLLVSLTISAQETKSFDYIESSTGLSYPAWESGDTELEFADINMDGFVDILSIGDHGSPNINSGEHGIMVWFGDGTGSWAVQMTGNFGYGGIAIGDVNNDGFWDVGYGMHHDYSSTDLGDQLLEVALGDGTGTNWTPWDDGLATNGEDWGLFGTDFADVDNDGDLDIGTNSFGSGSGLHVYINNGDGSWTQSFGIMPGNSNNRFVFGDINRDGNADFVVTHDAGIAFFGDGEGNFSIADYNLPSYSYPMFGPDLKDVNMDGADDLAYVNPNGGIEVWTFDRTNHQWIDIAGSLPSAGNYQQVQLCDFNSDGTLDLAAFGNAYLSIWKGALMDSPETISWTQVFNTITSDNGDCAAFRAGGDVDRNGFPDMVLVEKEGSWPNDQNHMKCFKETTTLFGHSIKAVYPHGKEVFIQRSSQFIDWISAVAPGSTAGVTIEYSLKGPFGPFISLCQEFSNGGRYQWTVPQTISSNNCFIRYKLPDGNDTLMAITPQAFTILGEEGLEADFFADSTLVYPNSEIQFADQSLGMLSSWQWDFDNDGTIDATNRNPVHAYTSPGTYTVKLSVSDGNNTQSEIKTDYITVLSPASAEDRSVEDHILTVYPNPAREHVLISSFFLKNYDKLLIDIIDSKGMVIDVLNAEYTAPGNFRIKYDVSSLPAGHYFVRINYDGNVVTRKLVIID